MCFSYSSAQSVDDANKAVSIKLDPHFIIIHFIFMITEESTFDLDVGCINETMTATNTVTKWGKFYLDAQNKIKVKIFRS